MGRGMQRLNAELSGANAPGNTVVARMEQAVVTATAHTGMPNMVTVDWRGGQVPANRLTSYAPAEGDTVLLLVQPPQLLIVGIVEPPAAPEPEEPEEPEEPVEPTQVWPFTNTAEGGAVDQPVTVANSGGASGTPFDLVFSGLSAPQGAFFDGLARTGGRSIRSTAGELAWDLPVDPVNRTQRLGVRASFRLSDPGYTTTTVPDGTTLPYLIYIGFGAVAQNAGSGAWEPRASSALEIQAQLPNALRLTYGSGEIEWEGPLPLDEWFTVTVNIDAHTNYLEWAVLDAAGNNLFGQARIDEPLESNSGDTDGYFNAINFGPGRFVYGDVVLRVDDLYVTNDFATEA